EPAVLEDREDLGQPAMAVLVPRRVPVESHVHLGGAEAGLHHRPVREAVAPDAEAGQLALEHLERGARVDERAQDHVPRGAARAIEVGQPHHWRLLGSLLASLLIWLAWAAAP